MDELRSIQKPAIFVEQVDGLRGWTRLALGEITLELQGEELPEVFSMASSPRSDALSQEIPIASDISDRTSPA